MRRNLASLSFDWQQQIYTLCKALGLDFFQIPFILYKQGHTIISFSRQRFICQTFELLCNAFSNNFAICSPPFILLHFPEVIGFLLYHLWSSPWVCPAVHYQSCWYPQQRKLFHLTAHSNWSSCLMHRSGSIQVVVNKRDFCKAMELNCLPTPLQRGSQRCCAAGFGVFFVPKWMWGIISLNKTLQLAMVHSVWLASCLGKKKNCISGWKIVQLPLRRQLTPFPIHWFLPSLFFAVPKIFLPPQPTHTAVKSGPWSFSGIHAHSKRLLFCSLYLWIFWVLLQTCGNLHFNPNHFPDTYAKWYSLQ